MRRRDAGSDARRRALCCSFLWVVDYAHYTHDAERGRRRQTTRGVLFLTPFLKGKRILQLSCCCSFVCWTEQLISCRHVCNISYIRYKYLHILLKYFQSRRLYTRLSYSLIAAVFCATAESISSELYISILVGSNMEPTKITTQPFFSTLQKTKHRACFAGILDFFHKDFTRYQSF